MSETFSRRLLRNAISEQYRIHEQKSILRWARAIFLEIAVYRDRLHPSSEENSDHALKKYLRKTDRMRVATLRPNLAADVDNAEKCLQRKKAFSTAR